MNGNIGVGEQGVNHETVDRENRLFVAQVQQRQVAMQRGAALDLLLGLGGVVEVQRDALHHVGQGQHFLYGVVAHVFDQVHHQLVVADPELAKAPEAGARVHQVVEQHPALGVQNFVTRKLGRVALVDRDHHVVERVRKAAATAVTLVHHPRRRRRAGVDDVVLGFLAGVAHGLGRVVVERKMGARHVGQVGGDVPVGDRYLAVLHVLGMHEFDLVDQIHFVQQNGAHKAVEVAARDKPVFLVGHGTLPGCGLKKRFYSFDLNRSPATP